MYKVAIIDDNISVIFKIEKVLEKIKKREECRVDN